MGKTSESLRQTLEGYSVGHSQLAQAIGLPESMLSQWLQGYLDLPADTIPTIVETLRSLNGHAADDFLQLYFGQSPQTGNHVLPLIAKQQLPESEQVNVASLAGLFGNFTNSYK
jgi:transcriptional regulator with XRE-family HTH domain